MATENINTKNISYFLYICAICAKEKFSPAKKSIMNNNNNDNS